MRNSLVSLILLVIFHANADAQSRRAKLVGPEEFSQGGPCDTTAWKLVFHDEFNGNTLDRSKWVTWFTYSADGSDQCEGCRIMGTSNTIFRDDLVRLENGRLLLGVRARSGEWYGRQKEHEAGMVHSVGDAKFTQGRFEVRCRIPRGAGLWPAFWGFGGETEIDVFEFCGETPNLLKGALHRWGSTKYSKSGRYKTEDLSRGFHTYAVEWDSDGLGWYLDGKLVLYRGRFVDKKGNPLPACDRKPGTLATAPYYPRGGDGLNIILDLAVSEPGGFCKGPKKPTPWPADAALEVDHVRVYQRQPQPNLSDLCALPRKLRGPIDTSTPLGADKEQRYHVEGPHGDLVWSTGPGLMITGQDAHGITVRNAGTRTGTGWLRVESRNDPCPRGPLMLEAAVELGR